MSVFSKIKSWISGGGSSSGGRSSSSGGRSSYSDSRASRGRAERVSNYGGGGSRSYRDYSSGGYRSDYEDRRRREKRQRDEQKKKRDATTKALASISNRTDALSSGRSATTAGGATSTGNGQQRVLAKLNEMSKSATADPKAKAAQDSRERARQTLQKIDRAAQNTQKRIDRADKAIKDFDKRNAESRKSYNKATGNKYNVDKNGLKARQAQKSQAYDVNAEKWETKQHPVATSFARGATSGVTFGGSELLAQTSKQRKNSGAEEYYQKNKNRFAEGAGEIAGSLAGFGLTGGASAKAVGKLAPKALKVGGEKVATRVAPKALIRRAAEREAVKRFGAEGATKEAIEQIVKRRTNQFAAELGKDAAINATTGLATDLSHAYLESRDENGRVDPKEFAKTMAQYGAMNVALGGATSAIPAFRVGRNFADDAIEGAVRNADDVARTVEPPRTLDDNVRVSLNRRRRTDVVMPEVRPQAAEEVPQDLWYHAGDRGKAEWYGNQAGSRRGTGHFGTGTYFAGSPEILEREGYGSRPLWEIDASKYNTYRPKDWSQAMRAHENLKKLNVESGDIDSLVKRAKLKESDLPNVIREYDRATTTEELENIAEKLFSKADREAIEDAAEERLKLWHEQGVNPEYGDFDIDDEIGDMLGDLDLSEIDFNDIDSVLDAAAARSAAKRGGRPLPPEATFEQAYRAELSDTIGKFLNDISENGNSTRKALRELGEDLGATPEQIDDALSKTQEVIDAYAHNNIFLKEDSASTIFMKELGFEGVNVKGIEGMDNTEFGSVIYDLRPEDGRLIREGKPRAPKAKAETPKAKAEAPNPKTEAPRPKTETPETGIVPRGEEARVSGERTEFRRDSAETAKEQARSKRTANNRERVSQETFDRDFEAFERRVSENQAKAEELKRQIRSASGEEKEALQAELKKLDAEIKSEYNRASLRYHPDRGGSNEWMGKFNNAYDEYKAGKFKSRGFKSAESSTRANTGARERYRTEYSSGGNGNTPPPRRGATESGERGFKRPKGRAANGKQRVMNSVEDIVYKRSERKPAREKISEATKSLRTQISDSLSAFEDVERQQAKAAKRTVDYGAIDEVRRHQTIANRSIANHQVKWNGERYAGTITRNGHEIENGKSLKDIYKGMDEDVERKFDAYLLLKHAPDRIREGKPIFGNTILKDGTDLNDPKACLEEADKLLKEHPEFAAKAEEIYQYTRNELQNRVDAGLLKKSVVDDWNKKYPYYVPTGRDGFNELHGVSGSTVGAGELKAAKGSDLDIRSVRDQLAQATTRNWRDMTTNEMFKRTFGDKIANELALQPDGGMQMVLDNTINLAKAHESGKYFADIFVDGKKHKVEIEKRFYDGLADLYKNGRIGNALIDTTNDAFAKVAGVWKSLITEWSPIFMVKNFMRDFPEAIINTRQTKEFLGSMGPAWKDLINGGEYSQALRDAGISQSTFIDLDKALREGAKEGKGIMSKLAKGNELTEMYPRLVEYMATFKKAGVDLKDADKALRSRAAANAADITVNFGRSGSVGKMLNRGFVPFFNPSAQGWSKFVRNITELQGARETLEFMAKATALGAAPLVASNFLYQDNPNYQMISARDKANNYIIAIPPTSKDTNMFIKIPRSRFASVYGLPLVNAFNDNKMGWAEAFKIANDQVAPIDPLESTLFSPFLAAKNNKSWYGSPIVPKSLEDMPKSEQYDANTSAIGRALGKATENLPREMQISPKKADYIIDAETGVAGDFLLPALTPSRQGGGNGILGKMLPAVANVPKRAFTIDSTTQNDLSARFYDKLQEANTSKQSAKATDADAEEYKRLSAYSTESSKISKAITELQNSDRSTKQDDIYGLQKVRNQLMQDALDGKPVPSQAKTLDAVQKYVGTSYAINNFGSSADKEAMKVYGASVYGNISDEEMQKKIDGDKSFYKGVRAVGQLEDKLAKNGTKGSTALSRAVALASVDASDEMFGAYQGTKKSRTETANKMDRARTYLADGGSVDEFVKLEKTRKTLGKLSDYDKDAELESVLKQLKNNEISEAEYYQKQGEIKYNANISYVGLATSLAQANAPARGYTLYDIKAKNVQKGINLAAMGFTARDYREMAKAVDADGNGYPKKQEIIDYVANSGIKDKATLYDALYYYKSSRNPFGTPTRYSRDAAAKTGRKNGVEAISGETGELKLKPDEESSSRSYGYRRRRGYRRRGYRRYGGGSGSTAKATVPKPKTLKASSLTKGVALGQKSKSSSSGKAEPPMLKRVEAKIDLPNKKR